MPIGSKGEFVDGGPSEWATEEFDTFNDAPPNVAAECIEDIVFQHLGIRGRAQQLHGERDQNFRLTANGSTGVFVKVSNCGESRDFLEAENGVIDYVGLSGNPPPVPTVLRNKCGESITEFVDSDGVIHLVRFFSLLEGEPLANQPKSDSLLAEAGHAVGKLTNALRGHFDSRLIRPNFLWNLDNCQNVFEWSKDIACSQTLASVRRFVDDFDIVESQRQNLRWSTLYQDANDHNILVAPDDPNEISGIVDFGDVVFGRTINEIAIAMAYVGMGEDRPIRAMGLLLKGYTAHFELERLEVDALLNLIRARLVQSICISAHRQKRFPENTYLSISHASASKLFRDLAQIDDATVTAYFRAAAGVLESRDISGYTQSDAPASVIGLRNRRYLRGLRSHSSASTEEEILVDEYGSALGTDIHGGHTKRSLGITFKSKCSIELRSPQNARVHRILAGDDSSTVVLRHGQGTNDELFSYFKNVDVANCTVGCSIGRGQVVATSAKAKQGDGYTHSATIQTLVNPDCPREDLPTFVDEDDFDNWKLLCPDPTTYAVVAPEFFSSHGGCPQELKKRRDRLLSPSLSLSYDEPLKIVRGAGPYLFGHDGRSYLDMVNNVTQVGHCHPHVVASIQKQVETLNTNARYLHDTILDYAERLTSLLPDPLNVCVFTCTGTEANELAIRMARTHTGRTASVSVDGAYHGHSTSLVDISPYKFAGPGGAGQSAGVYLTTTPDPYRGEFEGYSEESAIGYARDLRETIADARDEGSLPAFFICESLQGVAGQITPPKAYLRHAFAAAREAGVVCIADEVQVGFGRVGSKMWAFETQEAVPDIVTLGKPIGNGHPLSAVVTTREIAESFANGMEYFNTFGGNPVSCAAGSAVLDVIERDGLQESALETGSFLLDELRDLSTTESLVGDVRGTGLFIGVELVTNRAQKTPATKLAKEIVNRMKDRGILLSTEGPFNCVLKIKPPLVFGVPHAKDFLFELRRVFKEIAKL